MTDILKYIFKRTCSTKSTTTPTTFNSRLPSTITNTTTNTNKKPYFAPHDKIEANVYRHRRQIGVNLGSVFILDKALAPPSLRSCVVNDHWQNELDFLESCSTLDQAREALEDHWSSFITEKDFEHLASIGINSVRVPIGYWILDCGHFGPFKKYHAVYQSSWYWLLNMISAAAKYKIGVLIDLHGAPGGQNILITHCGTSSRKASFFKSTKNQEWTLKILKKLATELAPINNVIGLNILSKPMDDSSLFNFYLSAYKTIRQATPDIVLPIYISVQNDTTRYIDFIKRHRLEFVILDTHYHCFDQDAALAASRAEEKKRRRRSTLFGSSTNSSNESSHSNSSNSSSSPLSFISPPSPPPSPTTTSEEQSLKQCHIQSCGNMIIGEWTIPCCSNSNKIETLKEQSLAATSQLSQQRLNLYNQYSLSHYFWNYRTSDDGDVSSFLYWYKKLKVSNLSGLIPMKSVMRISQLAKSRFDKYAPPPPSPETVKGKESEEQALYAQGFKEGYQIALMYLEEYQCQIGFKQQLARQYSSNEKAVSNNTIYEKGFFHALLAIDQSIREFIS